MPWFKFYPADWIKGTRRLSAQEKGLWIDLLCLMWENDPQGQIEGSWESIARMVGEEWGRIEVAIMGLQRQGILEVVRNLSAECPQNVRIMSRRMSAECHARELERERSEKRRESDRLRKIKEREKNDHDSTAKKPGKKSEVRSQSMSFVVSQKTEKLLKPRREAPLPVLDVEKKNGAPVPGNKLTPVQEIVEVWKGLEGVSERPADEIKAWDRQFFARHASAAKALLGFLGSVETAVECMEDIRAKMVELGRDYSIETVVKWMDRWKQRKTDLVTESRHLAKSSNSAPVERLGVI